MTKHLVVAVFLWAGLAQVAQGVTLTCRGGGGVALGYESSEKTASLFFTPAYRATANLQPGECSWANRPFAANEIPCVIQKGVEAAVWWFTAGVAGRNKQSYANSTQATWYRPMTDKNQTVVFDVALRPGVGCPAVISFTVN